MDLNDLLYNLESLGFNDIILPFLLIFLITYGVLSNIYLFKNVRKIDAMLALVIAAYATIYSPMSTFLMEFIGGSVVIIVIITMVILIMASYLMFSQGNTPDSHLRFAIWKYAKWSFWIIVIVLSFVLRDSFKNSGITYMDPIFDLVPGFIVLLVFYHIIRWFVASPADDYKDIIKDIDEEAEEELVRRKYGVEDIKSFEGSKDINHIRQQIAVKKLNSGELKRKLTPENVIKLLDYYRIEDEARGEYSMNTKRRNQR